MHTLTQFYFAQATAKSYSIVSAFYPTGTNRLSIKIRKLEFPRTLTFIQYVHEFICIQKKKISVFV